MVSEVSGRGLGGSRRGLGVSGVVWEGSGVCGRGLGGVWEGSGWG